MEESARIKSELLARIRSNAARGEGHRCDILSLLAEHSIYHVLGEVLNSLDYLDIYSCSSVSKAWNSFVQDHLDRSKRLKKGWHERNPSIKVIQCDKSRSVCTVNELTSDGDSIFFGIGNPGNIELWDRRPHPNRKWMKKSAHPDGVYALEMTPRHCFSGGGEDGIIYVWDRSSGDLLSSLIAHEYIVWSIRFLVPSGRLLTASYDCSICLYSFVANDFQHLKTLKGPVGWADALELNEEILITQNDKTFVLSVWELNWEDTGHQENLLFNLSGHSGEVNCALAHKREFILSGSSDGCLRLWSYASGECLRVLSGLKGKVWCADMNSKQIVAGGRFGQIGCWTLDEDGSGSTRILQPHSHVTAVGAIKLEKVGLLSGDGEGHIFELDFWNSRVIVE